MNVNPSRQKILVAFTAAIAAAVTATPARAQPSIHIIEKGVYHAETIGRTITQEGTGVRNTVGNQRLISDTVLVHAKLDTRFGIRYILSGTGGTTLELNLVIRFPAPGLYDPTAGKQYAESAQLLTIQAGTPQYWEYHFENDWEIVPGVWTFEFWAGATMLASQRFCVVDARQSLDSAAKGCLRVLSGAT